MSILKKLREQTRPLGVKEIADLFDVTESTIQRWVRRGDIPAIRVNDTIRCDPQILADFIELASAASQHSRDFRYRLAQEPEESGGPVATDSQEGGNRPLGEEIARTHRANEVAPARGNRVTLTFGHEDRGAAFFAVERARQQALAHAGGPRVPAAQPRERRWRVDPERLV